MTPKLNRRIAGLYARTGQWWYMIIGAVAVFNPKMPI